MIFFLLLSVASARLITDTSDTNDNTASYPNCLRLTPNAGVGLANITLNPNSYLIPAPNFNVTTLVAGYFPKIGDIVETWDAIVRGHNSAGGIFNTDLDNFKPHEFGQGIVLKVFNRDNAGASTPPAFLFGSTFDNTTHTMLIAVNTTYRSIKVCRFEFCSTPVVASMLNAGSFQEYNHSSLFISEEDCIYQHYENFSMNNSMGTLPRTATVYYQFKYLDGIFTLDYAYRPLHNSTEPKFLTRVMQFPVNIAITRFLVPAVWNRNHLNQNAQNVARGSFVIEFAKLRLQSMLFTFHNGTLTNYTNCDDMSCMLSAPCPTSTLSTARLTTSVPSTIKSTTIQPTTGDLTSYQTAPATPFCNHTTITQQCNDVYYFWTMIFTFVLSFAFICGVLLCTSLDSYEDDVKLHQV
nr:ORF2 [Hipposideros armiger Coronavirus]